MRRRKALVIPVAALAALIVAGQASAGDGLLAGGALAPVTQALAPRKGRVTDLRGPVPEHR